MAAKRFAMNVGMNWLSMAVGMVVPFFLTPFVVRSLGSAAYGVWILAVSAVGYLNLLDLGLRSAIIRFVSKGAAEGRDDQARDAIGAAFWVRLIIAGGIGLLSVILAYAFPHLFKVPPALQHAGQVTVLLCAIGVAITLLSGVFGGVLSAIQRFDVSSSITVGQTVCRAAGVILILHSGCGLISLGIWELAIAIMAGSATVLAALKFYPACRVRIRRPHIETLRSIWSYSFKTFIIIVAIQIVFYTDNIVVGAFLSMTAVTLYSIAGSLAMYSGQVASAMGAVFIPMASGLDSTGRSRDLETLLLRGTQAALGLMLPVGLTLLLRGTTFIDLWMGVQYGPTSAKILQILLISQFFTIANSTAGQIAYGIDKHKSVATWAAIEAAFNLALSLILVRTLGLYGVAWGTSISQAVIHLIFWPLYVKNHLGVGVERYLWQGWAKMLFCSLPFAVASAAVDRYLIPSSMFIFFSQVLATLPVYALTVLVFFRKELTQAFQSWKLSRQTHAGVTT